MLCTWVMGVRAQDVQRYDVVISELMVDPAPVVGLPNAEFLELHNVSKRDVNLGGWRLADENGAGVINSAYLLKPDSFVVLCSSSSLVLFADLKNVLAVSSFPSLDNEGERLTLYSWRGVVVHSVAYERSWYRSDFKSAGGWSLEMIHAGTPCGGHENWAASVDPRGGTPGMRNSLRIEDVLDVRFEAVGVMVEDSVTLLVGFNRSLDSAAAEDRRSYTIDQGVGMPAAVKLVAPGWQELRVRSPGAMIAGKVYELSLKNLVDCTGERIRDGTKLRFGLPVVPAASDVIINEVMFNPKADGADYIELFNPGSGTVDVSRLSLASRNAGGQLSGVVPVAAAPRLLLPGAFVVVSSLPERVCALNVCRDPGALIRSSTPSMPDDAGDIVLLNQQGLVVDELRYDHHWHYPLLQDEEGVSLERISSTEKTELKTNWMSAAVDAGFGTPGYVNSQHRNFDRIEDGWTLEPKLFSPDGDGIDERLYLRYQFAEAGLLCNITVFDVNGRLVRKLVQSGICGTRGMFSWDGLADRQQPLGIGNYIVVIDVFSASGRTKSTKRVVTLARRS